MKEVTTQNDFASMYEAVSRRILHFKAGEGKFTPLPDVMLIDGSTGQIRAAVDAMHDQGITGVPVFGMVKDDRHRTRALMDPLGNEIGLMGNPAVFALVGNIQEETHRFAIEYHRTLRKKTIGSQLDEIPGVGAKRRAVLLKHFKSVKAISQATEEELCQAVPRSTAKAVYAYFNKAGTEEI